MSIILQHNLVVSAPAQKEGDKGAVPLVANPPILLTGKLPLITALQVGGGGETLPHLILKRRMQLLEDLRVRETMGLTRGTLV